MKYKIGDICCLEKGKQIDTSLLSEQNSYKYINGGTTESGYYTDYNTSGFTITVSEGGASCGFVNYIDEPFWCGCHCYRLTNIKFLPKYVYYVLKANQEKIMTLRTGTAMPNIKKSSFSQFEITLSEKNEEQEKIVNILDKVTALIAKRQQQLETLDNLVKSRFIEMFGDPEFNTKRLPVVCLSDVCEVGSSKRIYQSEQSMTGIPFLRISDLVTLMDTEELKADLYIPENRYRELKIQGLVPNLGDILVTSRGTLGRCYIVRDTDDFYFQDGMISWLSKFSGEVMPLYIQYLFAMDGLRKQIDGLQAGSTVAYLSISMLKKLKIMVPSLELQEQFADFVAQVDKSKFAPRCSIRRQWDFADRNVCFSGFWTHVPTPVSRIRTV